MMNAVPTQNVLFTSRIVCLLVACTGLANGGVISAFFSDYDKAIRPGFETGKPTTIRSNLYVESFGNIEEADMEFKVYAYFRQYWTDSRLAGKLNYTLKIEGTDLQKIWIPDPYCYNARESNMMIPNDQVHTFVSIKPNGDILYSKGITVLASCIMDLHKFPMDTQTCFLKFGSYGHTTKDIIYEWLPGETEVLVGHKKMAQFEYKGSNLTSDIDVFDDGNFSTITATFVFHRRIGYFLIQVYFPDIFVVVLSWIVFWMEKDDIGNRMALGITCVLTIMFLLGSLNGNLPKVSYPKALDWYLLVSFSFVFLSLIECLLVYLCKTRSSKDDRHLKNKANELPLSTLMSSSFRGMTGLKGDGSTLTSDNYKQGGTTMESDNAFEMAYPASKVNKGGKAGVQNVHKRADMIDNVSRVLFPLAFTVYNIFYWAYY